MGETSKNPSTKTKEYLKQLKHLDNLIKCKQQEIADQELIAVSLGINTDDVHVQTSNCSDKTGECAVKLADLKRDAIELCTRWANLKTDVNRILNQMSNKQYIIILNLYYCQNKTFEEISEFMDISYQWTYKLYKNALVEFEKCMMEDGSCEL